MEQYRLLAECLLPAHMLDWLDLQNVCVEKKDDTQVIHIYLDENEQKPDSSEDYARRMVKAEDVAGVTDKHVNEDSINCYVMAIEPKGEYGARPCSVKGVSA